MPSTSRADRLSNTHFGLLDLDDLQQYQTGTGQPLVCGPFAISTFPATHSVPTTALFVEAAGRKFGYSADTAYDPRLIDWLSPADLSFTRPTRTTPYALRAPRRAARKSSQEDACGTLSGRLRSARSRSRADAARTKLLGVNSIDAEGSYSLRIRHAQRRRAVDARHAAGNRTGRLRDSGDRSHRVVAAG